MPIVGTKIEYVYLVLIFTFAVFGIVSFRVWMNERRHQERREEDLRQREEARERDTLSRQLEMEEERTRREEARERRQQKFEEMRLEVEEKARYEAARIESERLTPVGTGSGGYIVIEMPENQRPFFHDLLKGFEDYARLKGYEIAFSIDSSLSGRIAFKFTVKNDGFVVGAERVRKDFKEYVNQVRNKGADDLDNLPVIVSIEEHNLLVAVLKNRISFLQHSYNLSLHAVSFYENLISNVRTFPAMPQASVVVQTGGTMDSRKYSALNSSGLIQGDSNSSDSSVNIEVGNSFNERHERVAALDDFIAKMSATESLNESAHKIVRDLSKAATSSPKLLIQIRG